MGVLESYVPLLLNLILCIKNSERLNSGSDDKECHARITFRQAPNGYKLLMVTS